MLGIQKYCFDVSTETQKLYFHDNQYSAVVNNILTVLNEKIKRKNINRQTEFWNKIWHNSPGRLLEEDHFCQAVNET